MSEIWLNAVPCPVCRAIPGGWCVDPRTGRQRLPHGRRLVVVAARRLLEWALPRRGDAVLAVQTMESLLRVWEDRRKPWDEPADVPAVDGDLVESYTYLACQQLTADIGRALEAINSRTLNLGPTISRCRRLMKELGRTRTTAHDLQDGVLRRPDGANPADDPPTHAQTVIWVELAKLEWLRERMAVRDAAAGTRWPDSDSEVWTARWHADGCLRVTRVRDRLALAGWAATSEVVPDLLRQWSEPDAERVTVRWHQPPPWPQRHPIRRCAKRPAHTAHVWTRPWDTNKQRHLAALAVAQAELRARVRVEDLDTVLTQAAERLNAHEPPGPSIGHALQSGHEHAQGRTCTAGWVDPRAVAYAGRTGRWNDFDGHRPGAVPYYATLLLTATPQHVADRFCSPGNGVMLFRIPGPAGPLYELTDDGTHRLHTARLLDFPMIWADITQLATPFELKCHDIVPDGTAVRWADIPRIVHRWETLIDRGYISGNIHRDLEYDRSTPRLRLDWTLTPWLPLHPDIATAWNRHYDRVYPGALARHGIPPTAWQNPKAWEKWLDTNSKPPTTPEAR